jgi:hypothetical protein
MVSSLDNERSMNRLTTFVRRFALASILTLASAGPILAQAVTTSAITGRVTTTAGEPSRTSRSW